MGVVLTYVVRLIFFLFISLGFHLLVLQLGASQQANVPTARQPGVGYVFRPVEGFFPQAEKKKLPENRAVKSHSVKPPMTKQIRVKPVREKIKDAPAETVVVQPISEPKSEVKPDLVQTAESSSVSQPVTFMDNSEIANSDSEDDSIVSQTEEISGGTQLDSEGSQSFQAALPRYHLNPLPKYPEAARRRGQQGTVQLEVLVLADGRVGNTRLYASSGYKTLDRAARTAVKRWQFEPATSYAVPVESRVVIPVDFVLSEK